MARPIVAIVGRPNVGKSTLFNRLLGRRQAIVDNRPGATRDRHYGEADWAGKPFSIIDTGGFVPDSADVFEAAIREQARISIEEADVIIFVVDVVEGLHPIDKDIADILRRSSKNVLLAANKTDNAPREADAAVFFALGLGDPLPVSALGGRLIGDFLDRLTEGFPERPGEEEEHPDRLHLAIIGRPNVGKSSLTNAFLGRDRSIVTDLPGTTRDAIDSPLNFRKREIVLIDTAGLRRRSKIRESIEYYSVLRTLRAIGRADVTLLLIDAEAGLTHQDIEVLSEAAEMNKGIVLAVNKWDLIEKDTNTARRYEERIRESVKTFDYVPVLFISALTKQRIHRALETCVAVFDERARHIPTAELNDAILPLIEQTPPPATPVGREVKIKYVTQVRANPPVILFFCNEPKHIPESYRRFLERRLRERFGFAGVPLTLQFRRK